MAAQPRLRATAPPAPPRRRELTAGGVIAALVGLAAMMVGLRLRSGIAVGIVLTAAIFIPTERLLALRPGQRILRRQFWSDLVHFSVNGVLSNVGAITLVGVTVAVLHAHPSAALQAAVATQPGALQVVEALLLAEVAGYWAHRAAHAVPLLWRFHKVHHSIEEMDWLASARLHPIDQAVTRGAAILPLYILGFSRLSLGGLLAVLTLQALFIHSNVRVGFGPLRHLVATPQFHHWHHSNEPQARNRNFAGELPVLDRLFGTLHLPAGNRFPSVYGVDEPLPRTWAEQMLVPFRAPAVRPVSEAA